MDYKRDSFEFLSVRAQLMHCFCNAYKTHTMATLTSVLELNGPIGGLSFYKRKDSGKIIVRSRGGASREKIKEAASMEGTRLANAEFGGRASTCKKLKIIYSHRHIRRLK